MNILVSLQTGNVVAYGYDKLQPFENGGVIADNTAFVSSAGPFHEIEVPFEENFDHRAWIPSPTRLYLMYRLLWLMTSLWSNLPRLRPLLLCRNRSQQDSSSSR